VLLLDEATSDLDLDNERLVNAAIRATRVTRVIVAHRPETIRSADRVINLDEIAGHAVAHRPALPGAGRAVGPAGPAAQIGSI
jgi:ATP-binding cassette subfamily B protein RaxB